jgi:nitrite reductase/ring-hydroxylating ferredoxin subunit
MGEAAWEKLDGMDPQTGSFPARARVAGESIIILKTPTGFRGVQRTCPHQQVSFMDALLVGNGTMLRCAEHAFTFKLSTGKGVNCAGYKIAVYDVKAEDGGLFARPAGE